MTQDAKNQIYDLRILDGLRGLAAFYVMVGHARWLLWEGYSAGFVQHRESYSALGKLIVYLSSGFILGHEAVLFFFVLSGFVIHLRYAKQLRMDKQQAKFDWRSYVYRRAKRLYPTLIFAMAFTWLLDWIGQAKGYPIYSNNAQNSSVVLDISHSWLTALGNLAFVMTTYVSSWGSNGPLWSLKFEWWFYMAYPVFWWFSKKSIALATALMCLLFFLSFYPQLWPLLLLRDVFSAMLAWWFGVLLADIFSRRLAIPFSFVAPLSALLLILPVIHLNDTVQAVLWGLAFSGVVAGCFVMQQHGWKLRILSSLKPLGDMSFTLYVIHFPLLVLLSGWLMSSSASHALPRHFGWALFGVILCTIIAYVAHFFAEKPFITRKTLETT